MTAIVLVSHSEAIANGTKDLLKDISKDVNIIAYGGENHKYGTSADDILTILNQLEEDALCFYDLGSADRYEFRLSNWGIWWKFSYL